MKAITLLALVVVIATFSGVAKADQLAFTATLTGTQEVPPTGSPGIGSALITVDTVAHIMIVNVSFAGLANPTTVAHIHCCAPPGVNALVATTTPTFPGFPAGVMTGTYLHNFDLTLASTYNLANPALGGNAAAAEAAFIAGLVGGLAYFNIHTTGFPGGEIRGQLSQIQAVAEPATLLLLGTGLAGVVAAVRRRRARR